MEDYQEFRDSKKFYQVFLHTMEYSQLIPRFNI